jgi:hypothetical protein
MNNYDISSEGDNIEFNVFYDYHLAQQFYRMFEADNTRLNFGRDNSLFLIGDCEKPYYKKANLLAKSKNELFELCHQYELISYSIELNDYKKSEYISDLLNITIKRHYEWLTSQYNWHGIREHITHDYYISNGYSQGDSVYIVSLDNPIDKSMRKYIDNVLWDSPISINAKINDDDFYDDDFLDNHYEWDTEKIKLKIKALDLSDYAKQWLCKALPQYPRYL